MKTLRMAVILLAGVVGWAAAAPAAERVYTLPGDHGSLVLPVPEGWSEKMQKPQPHAPPTIRLRESDDDGDFVAFVTALWPEFGAAPDFGTAAGVRRIVAASAARMADRAVEREIELVPIGGGRTGFYFVATDKALVGRTPPPGEYRYVTQGALTVGGLLCTFTLYANEDPSDRIEAALDMLRAAAHRTGL